MTELPPALAALTGCPSFDLYVPMKDRRFAESLSCFYTYLHCKPDGTPFYVGKGRGKRAAVSLDRNAMYVNICKKYGRQNIVKFIAPCESEAVAFSQERAHIAALRTAGYKLANATDGGEGNTGNTRTPAERARFAAVNRGRSLTPEHKANISRANLGKKRSVAACKKISDAKRGTVLSEDHRAKLLAAIKGVPKSAEHKRKLSELNKRRIAEKRGEAL